VDRQIGVVKVPRDRYVARESGSESGTLTTRVLMFEGQKLTLNVVTVDGEISVQVTTPDGQPVPGFAFNDCQPISEDSLAVPVKWKEPLSKLAGKPIRLQISMRNAQLYALGIE
jgi:hypothetical protein